MDITYVYILLDPRKKGIWKYKNFNFNYQPFYVGVGVDKRMNSHSYTRDSKNCENNIKTRTVDKIKKQGLKIIAKKIYKNLKREDAYFIEKELITHFGRLIEKNGILTNIASGGGTTCANELGDKNYHSKEVYQYSLEGDFIKKWKGLRQIGRILKVCYNTIGDCCRSNLKNTVTFSAHGFMWFYDYKETKTKPYKFENGQSKRVYQYSLKTLKLLNKFENGVKAAREIKSTKYAVSKSCKKGVKLKDYIFSHNKLSLNKLESIRNKYPYYKVIYNGKKYIAMDLKEVSKIINIPFKTVSYYRTYKKDFKGITIIKNINNN